VAEALSDAVLDLRRLPLILERLSASRDGSHPVVTGTTPPAGPGPTTAGTALHPRTALLAEAILEAALGANTGAELDAYLDRIRQRGGAKGTDEMFARWARASPAGSCPRWRAGRPFPKASR
jgi:hypothetical protein